MIKLDSIKKLMECAVISGYLKDEQPISLFLIGRPESGKSELIKVMRDFPNTFYTNDLSYKGCVDYVLPEVENNKISHILIPDFINIVSHKKAAATLVPLLNSLMSEGLKDLKIYGTKKEYRDPLFCGVITGITKEIFDKKIIYWRNIGFLTRMLVVTYGYTQLTKMAIHEYIRSGNYNNRIKPGADLTNIDKFRLRGLSVEIPKDIAKDICALANAEGGYIIIGVDDTGRIVGFKGDKRVGQYGIEGYYENDLKGKQGFLKGAKDASGNIIESITSQIKPAENGAKLILTIDKNIQFKAEKELKEAVEKWDAKGGTIIVMEPKTGKILSMVSFPNFDPNNYNKVEDINVFLNPAISCIYEPGSVFKPFTIAGALEEKLITPKTTYKDTGKVKIKGYIISNVEGKSYGNPTITEVLEKSINTGAVFVQRKLGKELFKKYVEKFGFSQKTGIDLQGEIAGNISNLDSKRDIDYATASFGQGIAVTPIELITAFSAIANGGKLLKPFVVEKEIFYDNREKINHPTLINQVISTSTAETLTKMLVSVVDNGYGKKAKVDGYFIAGKTGTAQVPEKGTYSKDRTIHTFIGFAPAFDPRFTILVKLDEPKGIRFAADSCAPIFRKLAEFIFNYLKIPPQ